MNEENFHDFRRAGIGGSDIAAVLNLPPYGCAARLFDEKRGIPEDYPETFNPHMERGRRLEPIIADMYEAATGNECVIVGPAKRRDEQYLRGHADSFIIPADENKSEGILECKAPARQTFYQIKREGLPESWILQMQHYLYVYNRPWGAFAVLWAEGWEFLTFEVQRDDALIKSIVDAATRFWVMVENGPRPERLEFGDKRCVTCRRRVICLGLDIIVDSAHQAEDNGDVTRYEDMSGDAEFSATVRSYLEAREIYDDADDLLGERRATLEASIGQRQAVLTADARISFKPVTSTRFDSKAFEKAHPDMKKQFTKTSTSRVLRVNRIGE